MQTVGHAIAVPVSLNRLKSLLREGVQFAIGGTLALYVLFPVVWLFLASLKDDEALWALPVQYWPSRPVLTAYADLFTEQSQARQLLDWPILFRNSMFIALTSVLIVVFFAGSAGYSFSRLRFPGQNVLLSGLLISRMFQGASLLLPTYRLMNALGLRDSLWGLVILYSAFGIPFATWICASVMREIPYDLEEAAMMDGCSRLGAMWRVVLPLARPGLITAALWHFVGAWSEFAFASVLIENPSRGTVTIGLVAFTDYFTIAFNRIGAAATLIAVPILTLFTVGQKYLTRGLLAGAVKG